jgi:hypothetical protein
MVLKQINIQLHHVVSDLTGVNGMKNIRAILAGERDPQALANHRERRWKPLVESIAKALQGNWRQAPLFTLRQAVELFEVYQQKIENCDQAIGRVLDALESQTDQATPSRCASKSSAATHRTSISMSGCSHQRSVLTAASSWLALPRRVPSAPRVSGCLFPRGFGISTRLASYVFRHSPSASRR